MVFLPTLRSSAAGCSGCRTSLLRLFTAPYAPAITTRCVRRTPQHLSPALLLPRTASARHQRLYSTGPSPGADEAAAPSEAGPDPEENAASPGPEATADQSSQEQPWYLDEDPPRHPALIPEAQPLPDIPDDAPAILADLVRYVAEDMGLDDLNLMDLRALDPPAALGPSLIMLFGTARSDRHLHISAGLLRSWLRDRGIHAHADGLLGRKEFKIKQRRAQRKAKLLGTSANPAAPNDTYTTRWVCMNLGTIGSTPSDETAIETAGGGFTGFGTRQTGTTIVVQMLTESKRTELDLETLWSRILARRGKTTVVEDDLEYVEADTPANELSVFDEGGSPKVMATPLQRRFFSTSSRRRTLSHESDQVTHPPQHSPPADNVDTLLDPVTYLGHKLAELEQLQAQFADLAYQEAVEALGHSETGQLLASPFLRSWNRAMRFLPREQSWQFRLWLLMAGRKLALPRFTLSSLRDLVHEMELYGIICYRDHYLEMLQGVYLEPSDGEVPVSGQSELALEILNVMLERGEPIVTTDVIISLIESLARTQSPGQQKRELQAVLEKFMLQADLPYMGESAIVRLLDAYAAQDNWERWWEVWRVPPKHLQARSETLYVHLWATMAASGHQRRCREAIRECFYEMLREHPPIKPAGAVKESLEACIRIADPSAEEIARRVKVSDRRRKHMARFEFVHMFKVLNPQWDDPFAAS